MKTKRLWRLARYPALALGLAAALAVASGLAVPVGRMEVRHGGVTRSALVLNPLLPPDPGGQLRIVLLPGNIQVAPDPRSRVLGQVEVADIVVVSQQHGEFFKVKLLPAGPEGYLHRRHTPSVALLGAEQALDPGTLPRAIGPNQTALINLEAVQAAVAAPGGLRSTAAVLQALRIRQALVTGAAEGPAMLNPPAGTFLVIVEEPGGTGASTYTINLALINDTTAPLNGELVLTLPPVSSLAVAAADGATSLVPFSADTWRFVLAGGESDLAPDLLVTFTREPNPGGPILWTISGTIRQVGG